MGDAERGQVSATAAEVYEEFFVPALFGQFAATTLDRAGIRRGDRILDVGCGTGIVARSAVGAVGPGGSVAGLDINPGMLAVARRLSSDVDWIEAPAEEIPFPDDEFGAVTCQFALMFFADPSSAIAEMQRVVAPGRRVVVATWADVSTSPGYEAMVEVLDAEIGPEAADALRVPFSIGTESGLAGRLEPIFDRVEVETIPGTARFSSIDAWMQTDIRGWTLADMIDDARADALVVAGREKLAPFEDPDGGVEFDAPAIVAVASN